jgi:hypothetical protein
VLARSQLLRQPLDSPFSTRPSGRSIAAHSAIPCARHSSSSRAHSLNTSAVWGTVRAAIFVPSSSTPQTASV